MTEPWRTASGREIRVSDMSLSHIQNAIELLYRNCLEAREFADKTESHAAENRADQMLEFAQKWFRIFGEELVDRKSSGIMFNDPRLTPDDVLALLPDDLEEFAK